MPRTGPDYAPIGVRGIIGRFYRRMEGSLAVSWALMVSLMIDSDQETETYKFLGMVPQLREWKGGRLAKALRVDGFTLSNKTFEATLHADLEDLRRDKTGQLAIRMGELGRRAGTHWASLLTTLLEANGNGYDGVAFFATSHSLGNSGTQKNLLTATEVGALNVSDAANPTADEWQDIVGGIVGWFYSFKDDQGEPINGDALEFVLMVPPLMLANAIAAVRSGFRKSGSTPEIATNDFTITVVPNARLTNANYVYMFRTDSEMKPLIAQGEVEPMVKVLGPESEHAILHNEALFAVKAVRNVTYGEPLHAIRATLS